MRSPAAAQPHACAVIYSSTGFSAAIAQEITEAADRADAEVRLLKAAEPAPEAAIASNETWAAHAAADAGIPVATSADVEWANVVIFGTPTRFGNISSQLKQFMDTLGGLCAQGKLADKVYSGFVTTATKHGGPVQLGGRVRPAEPRQPYAGIAHRGLRPS